ncbi:baculoviral IAP repeat-containing protein 7-B-like protein, partial [Leptotrombidium deliense]
MNRKVVRHAVLRFLNVRLATFSKWPLKNPTALEMAKAGFYFTGVGTTAVCYSCGVSESDWDGHCPQLLHRLLFRTCPHLIGFDTTIKARSVVPGEVIKSTACALPAVPYEADPEDEILLFKEDKLESPPTKKSVGQFPEVFEEMVVPLTIYVRIEKPTSNTL